MTAEGHGDGTEVTQLPEPRAPGVLAGPSASGPEPEDPRQDRDGLLGDGSSAEEEARPPAGGDQRKRRRSKRQRRKDWRRTY